MSQEKYQISNTKTFDEIVILLSLCRMQRNYLLSYHAINTVVDQKHVFIITILNQAIILQCKKLIGRLFVHVTR
jgi:hypothetical protein